MKDWFDYASPGGLDRIYETDWDGLHGEDDDLIMLDFSECEDKYINEEVETCELL